MVSQSSVSRFAGHLDGVHYRYVGTIFTGVAIGTVTITSSEFNRDSGQAKREARSGPVIITNRGAPAHVLLTWEDYRRLAGHGEKTIVEVLALPGVEDVDFDPPRLDDPPQPALLD